LSIHIESEKENKIIKQKQHTFIVILLSTLFIFSAAVYFLLYLFSLPPLFSPVKEPLAHLIFRLSGESLPRPIL